MATCGPRAAVQAPIRAASRIGLVTAARNAGTLLDLSGQAARPFVGGVEFDQDGGPDSLGTVDPFADHVKPIIESTGTDQWDPFLIWTGEQCSTFGGSVDEVRQTAEARLLRQTSHMVEGVVWTNLVDGVAYNTGSAHPNIGLANAAATQPNGVTAAGLVTAFSDMILALADTLGSERGMIHVDARLLPFLGFYGLVMRDGNQLVTSLADHIVAAGTGYIGSAPATPQTPLTGEESWIYGTGLMELVLGPVDAYVSTDSASNTVEARAERPVLVSWDTQTHIGIPVCIPDPGPACTEVV